MEFETYQDASEFKRWWRNFGADQFKAHLDEVAANHEPTIAEQIYNQRMLSGPWVNPRGDKE